MIVPFKSTRNASLFNSPRWRKFRKDLLLVLQGTSVSSDRDPTAIGPLELMVIALEDRRFFRHSGVDWRSVLREVSRALTFRKHGGFSTIDMQFVRTITGYRRRTIRRKVYEIVLAIVLQLYCDKPTILKSYLACAYFGSGLIGANAAARKVFGKEADQLDVQEAAFIAAMLACPRPLNGPPKWEVRARRRAAYGLKVLHSDRQRLIRRYDLQISNAKHFLPCETALSNDPHNWHRTLPTP